MHCSAIPMTPSASISRLTPIEEKVQEVGADGRLLWCDGNVYQVNLLEKLLVTVLSKLTNFVPGGGIWMNTQRPEWNDANNALVGTGVSMVTLCYVHRFYMRWTGFWRSGVKSRSPSLRKWLHYSKTSTMCLCNRPKLCHAGLSLPSSDTPWWSSWAAPASDTAMRFMPTAFPGVMSR